MKEWKGTMQTDNFIAKVIVYLEETSDSSPGDWHGHGITLSPLCEPGEYKTNIGNIVIDRNDLITTGYMFYFVGQGKPKLI